jgi:hypothetical protein
MSHRLGHPEFDSALGVFLDYSLHGSLGWGRVSGVYSPRVGIKSEGPSLIEVPKKKKKKKKKLISTALSFGRMSVLRLQIIQQSHLRRNRSRYPESHSLM